MIVNSYSVMVAHSALPQGKTSINAVYAVWSLLFSARLGRGARTLPTLQDSPLARNLLQVPFGNPERPMTRLAKAIGSNWPIPSNQSHQVKVFLAQQA